MGDIDSYNPRKNSSNHLPTGFGLQETLRNMQYASNKNGETTGGSWAGPNSMAHCRTKDGSMADPLIYQFWDLQKSRINDTANKYGNARESPGFIKETTIEVKLAKNSIFLECTVSVRFLFSVSKWRRFWRGVLSRGQYHLLQYLHLSLCEKCF